MISRRSLLLLAATMLSFAAILTHGASPGLEVIWQLRLPRALAGFAAGGLLTLCAWSLQALFRNPLVEPYVLGTSGGAALGGLLSLLWLGTTSVPGSLVGALVVTLILLFFARRIQGHDLQGSSIRLLLIGVMLAAITSACINLVMVTLPDRQLRGAVFWLLGDLSSVISSTPLLLTSVTVLLWAWWRHYDILRLQWGEREAFYSGSQARQLQWEIPLLSSVAVGLCVSEVGAIGFVGLVAPQAVRYLFGALAKDQVLNSWLMGGMFLMLADWLSYTIIAPSQLPIGAIVALIGAPLFIALLLKSVR